MAAGAFHQGFSKDRVPFKIKKIILNGYDILLNSHHAERPKIFCNTLVQKGTKCFIFNFLLFFNKFNRMFFERMEQEDIASVGAYIIPSSSMVFNALDRGLPETATPENEQV